MVSPADNDRIMQFLVENGACDVIANETTIHFRCIQDLSYWIKQLTRLGDKIYFHIMKLKRQVIDPQKLYEKQEQLTFSENARKNRTKTSVVAC